MDNDHLDKILKYKKEELAAVKRRVSSADVRAKARDAEPLRDFLAAVNKKGRVNIITEIKKASPSAGLIRPDFDPVRLAQRYEEGGAAALSILTDEKFFQGSLKHLESARAQVKIPCLRKDFLFDDYQIHEARAAGADAVLLIVRVLEKSQLKDYLSLAGELNMTALVEVHNEKEMEIANGVAAQLIGINNRDLDTLRVDLENAVRLAKKSDRGVTLVAESGLSTRQDLEKLRAVGISTFLIGEVLLRAPDPGKKLREFLR